MIFFFINDFEVYKIRLQMFANSIIASVKFSLYLGSSSKLSEPILLQDSVTTAIILVPILLYFSSYAITGWLITKPLPDRRLIWPLEKKRSSIASGILAKKGTPFENALPLTPCLVVIFSRL